MLQNSRFEPRYLTIKAMYTHYKMTPVWAREHSFCEVRLACCCEAEHVTAMEEETKELNTMALLASNLKTTQRNRMDDQCRKLYDSQQIWVRLKVRNQSLKPRAYNLPYTSIAVDKYSVLTTYGQVWFRYLYKFAGKFSSLFRCCFAFSNLNRTEMHKL